MDVNIFREFDNTLVQLVLIIISNQNGISRKSRAVIELFSIIR